MGVPTNTLQAVSAVNYEDLEDAVYNVDPEETPILSMCGRTRAKALKHEWNLDSLASPVATNAAISGDDPSNEALTATTRVGNFCQIADKTIQIADENEHVAAPDDNNTMEYQMAKKLTELKKDVDTQISQNKASVAPTTSVAGVSGSVESWITTNDSRGASGTDGGYNSGTGVVDAPGDGTQRALQEDFLKSVLQQIYSNTRVDPSVAFFGPAQLNQATAVLTGIAQPVREVGNKSVTIIASAEVYVSPWGKIMLKPSRHVRERSVPILNPGYWKVGYLRPFQVRKLAKTGDSEKRQAIVQYTLVPRAQKSSGIIADLTVPA